MIIISLHACRQLTQTFPPNLNRQTSTVPESVESQRERTMKLNCLSIQEKENSRLIYRREKRKNSVPTAKAGVRSRVPVPSPHPQHGACRGRWGLARPTGAASLRPHPRVHQHRRLRKSLGQTPSQQKAKKAKHNP